MFNTKAVCIFKTYNSLLPFNAMNILLIPFILAFLLYLLPTYCALAQTEEDNNSNSPKFKMTKWSKPVDCQQKGSKFETGYVDISQSNSNVEVAIFFQKTDGTWVKKTFQRTGSGYIQINVTDCDFTGNHYGYVCESGEACKFPTESEVSAMHAKSPQLPRFKVTKRSKKDDCNGVNFEDGYVYSPSGKTVEVSIYMEKKDGTWRKKHYLYYGTGNISLGIADCDLTGNYKATVQYIEQ